MMPDDRIAQKRTRQVLEVIADAGRPMAVAEIGDRIGKPATSVRNYLNPLLHHGFIEVAGRFRAPGVSRPCNHYVAVRPVDELPTPSRTRSIDVSLKRSVPAAKATQPVDRDAVRSQLEADVAAYLARGQDIEELPSPPERPPAFSPVGGGRGWRGGFQ